MYVQNETPHTEELAEQIHQLLTQATPWVEKATGLLLPTVRVELVGVEGLATAYAAFVRRQVERDTEGLDLTERERKKAAALPLTARGSARTMWMVEESVLIATGVGQPSALIVPEALEHLGLTGAPDLLCDALVRALARQAQVAACGGTLIPAPEWPVVRPAKDAITQLSDGHAQWTSDQATPQILGRPVDCTQRRRPRTFLVRRAVLRIADPGAGRRRARAAALVDKAVNAVGLDAFNQVWSASGLAPTLGELRCPEDWISRLPG
ncbi:zinc-dependent metalloprotease [Streptomyces sp. NPDC002845]